ncbi:MAG TPA: TolC family protein, partial [Chryseolinea sp.]
MKLRRLSTVFILFHILVSATAQEQVVTLEQVIALALEKNYDIRVSKNLAYSAATDDKFAPGFFLPVIQANGIRTWNRSNSEQTLANDSVVIRDGIRTNNLIGNVQLSWLLFDGGRMFATRERIAQIEAQGELNVKSQMVNTIADVSNNYYNIVRQKQQLNAIREQMGVSEERVRLADRRLAVGTAAKPELLQAKVDLNSQRTAVLAQQTLIAMLKDQLNGLIGMQLPPVFEVSDSIVINLDIQEETIATNIDNTNFFLQSAKRDVDIATLALRERKGERYPFLNFNSSYNYTRNESNLATNPFSPLTNQNRGLNYGFSVNLPIINGFINRRNIQQARITVDRTMLLYQQSKMTIDVGVKNAYVSYNNAK